MKASTISLLVSVALATSSASAGNWTLIGSTDDRDPSNVSYHTALYLEMPVIRSNDSTLVVAHYRVDWTPGMKGLRPGEETKSIEAVQAFDCTNHEHWSIYGIGLPFPALRNTVFGSGSHRQIVVNDYVTGADVDWADAEVGAHVCGNK